MTNATQTVLRAATIPSGRAKGHDSKSIMVSLDGSTFYCAGVDGQSCDYTADSYYAVMSHRNSHRIGGARNGSIGKDPLTKLHQRAASLLKDIEALQATPPEPQVAHVHGNTVDWKARAQAAERDLARIKRTFSSLTG
jgi:hypothetical protein